MTGVSDEIEDLLTSEPLVATLGTCVDGRPHVAPLWYRYEDDVVEIVTTGRKLANIRENPRVALAVEKSTDGRPEWTVSIRGTATIIEDEDAFRTANRRINRKYGADEDAWTDNTLVRIDVGSASHRTYE
ncbi:MAG: nitroimidazol reductase NimA-like FMN-containing flavoprotein [Halobacteriales archaeon]|jgi:nitroimidazol reductase NimA-like FMN-containing flavoprotein (pyridoxamine 5'-phosphate oxidase superfamily)